MKSSLKFMFCAVLAVALMGATSANLFAEETTSASSQEEKKDPNVFKVFWKDGLNFQADNVDFKIGGRFMHDWIWGSLDDGLAAKVGDIVSMNGTRRSRIGIEGTLYGRIEIKMEYDFAGGTASYTDVYLGIKGLPFGTLRLGKQKEPFSLEELTSSRHITFIERSLVNMFAPARQVGATVHGSMDDRFTWNLGVFTRDETGTAGGVHDDTYDFAARFTFLPWTSGKTDLFHIGAAYHYQDMKDNAVTRYRTRPEVSLIQRFIDTGNFAAESAQGFGIEGAFVVGSFHGFGEYVMEMTDAAAFGDPEFNAFTIGAGYYLTGEVRNFKKSAGTFDRTKVLDPLTKDGGMGAWEVAVRYSQADLTDAVLKGGELKDITVALNWYLNNNAALKLNYVYSDRDDIEDGTGNMFVTRFQFDF